MKNKFYVGANIRLDATRYYYPKHKQPKEITENCFINAMFLLKNEFKGNAIQLFFDEPGSVHRKLLNKQMLKDILNYIKKHDIYFVIHSSFAINFCRPVKDSKHALTGYINELINTHYAGGSGCVLHTGIYKTKRYSIPYQKAQQNMVNNILVAIRVIKEKRLRSKVIIETPATFTQVGYTFNKLKELYNQFSNDDKKYIRFCIDTAHVHSTGYDIRSRAKAKKTLDHFNNIIGLHLVEVIHFNDSKKPIGSGIDEHQAIGFGTIGNPKMGGHHSGLAYIAEVASKMGIPLVQETKDHDFKKRISMIRQWGK